MRKVMVASKNPVKIDAVKIWFEKMFPEETFEFVWVSVKSEVADQPLSYQETLLGATNRANNAKNKYPNADYWVWIEWWLEKRFQDMKSFAWVVTLSDDRIWRGKTWVFFLPKKVIDLIDQWKELWEADDIVFWQSNSKQNTWAVGLLTDNIITRTSYYSEAVIFSLIPFKNYDLF